MSSSAPLSRREQQQQTRDAIVIAARAVFAEDGYHRANLARIAREAGFSKGAVYSNFTGKADLFLAVLDANVETVFDEGGWDVRDAPPVGGASSGDDAPAGGDAAAVGAAIEGFALATLEFIATAARDEQLVEGLAQRLGAVVAGYAAIAEASQPQLGDLELTQLGALLAALDQGAALLSLGGSTVIDQRVLRAGMQRLLVVGEGGVGEEAATGPVTHDRAFRARVARAMREEWAPGSQPEDPGEG